MKKKIAVLLTAVMMLSCSTMFLAAGSVSTDVKVPTTVKTESGAVVTVTANTDTTVAEANLSVAEDVLVDIIKEDAEVAKVAKDAEVFAMVDIDAVIPDGESIELTFTLPGVEDGQYVVVMHYDEVEGEIDTYWLAEVVNGTVTIGDVTSCSPFYFAKATAPAQQPVQGGQIWGSHEIPTTGAATLPKTGAPVVLPFAALACVAGAVVCGRKSR